MTAALILLLYAAGLCLAGPSVMAWRGWSERAPKVGILMWQAMTGGVVASVTLSGFALALSNGHVSAGLAAVLRACMTALRSHYAAPGGPAAAAVGGAVTLVVVLRVVWCVTSQLSRAVKSRARHHEILSVVARPALYLGAMVVEHDAPAMYCLPGQKRRIVVTTGALRLLTVPELAAALAHEHAHLERRHDLVLAWSGGLAAAFGRVPLFMFAHVRTRRLVELHADDVAARSNPRLPLAEALLKLAGSRTPSSALGAGGSTAAERVRRLIAPQQPLGRAHAALASGVAAALICLPLVCLAAPVIADHFSSCPPPVPSAGAAAH